jgi:hypothetical protein
LREAKSERNDSIQLSHMFRGQHNVKSLEVFIQLLYLSAAKDGEHIWGFLSAGIL